MKPVRTLRNFYRNGTRFSAKSTTGTIRIFMCALRPPVPPVPYLAGGAVVLGCGFGSLGLSRVEDSCLRVEGLWFSVEAACIQESRPYEYVWFATALPEESLLKQRLGTGHGLLNVMNIIKPLRWASGGPMSKQRSGKVGVVVMHISRVSCLRWVDAVSVLPIVVKVGRGSS